MENGHPEIEGKDLSFRTLPFWGLELDMFCLRLEKELPRMQGLPFYQATFLFLK